MKQETEPPHEYAKATIFIGDPGIWPQTKDGKKPQHILRLLEKDARCFKKTVSGAVVLEIGPSSD